MKIAVVHSFYARSNPSGENAVVEFEVDHLRQLGHDVQLVKAETDDLSQQRDYAVRSALRVSTGAGRSPLAQLRAIKPDVVHVHNLFPNFGHRWLPSSPAPVVTTLHNFRTLCASATLFRDGAVCHDCLDRGKSRALIHACYRGSRPATIPLWLRHPGSAATDPLLNHSQRLIVLSERARQIFSAAGVPSGKLTVLPNPSPSRPHSITPPQQARWLYVGRLSPEKGIKELVLNWSEDASLDVVGSGPLEGELRQQAPAGVHFLGQLPHSEVQGQLSRYTGLLFPSLCYEMSPLIFPEALSVGLPVIALRGNVVADDVSRLQVGAVLEALRGEAIRSALDEVSARTDLRQRCVDQHRQVFATDQWAADLLAVLVAATQAEHRPVAVLNKP